SCAACASSGPRTRPRRPGPPSAPRSSSARSVDGVAVGVPALADLLEDRRRLLPAPAEDTREIGRRQLARLCEDERRQLAPRLLTRRQARPHLPLPRHEVVGERPPRAALVDQ